MYKPLSSAEPEEYWPCMQVEPGDSSSLRVPVLPLVLTYIGCVVYMTIVYIHYSYNY